MTRVVFLGQKWIGERCFDLLLAHPGVEACAVVTNATADAWWGSNRAYRRAVELGLPVLANDRRRDDELAALIGSVRPDAILCVQHPWILPASTLALVGGAAFNMHSAKLPEYRGHNAVNHAILNGETTYTVTVHRMVAEADAGPIALEETIAIAPSDTARGLYERALPTGELAFARLLDALAPGPDAVGGRAMIGSGAFYARSSIDGEREIRASDDAATIDRRVRALFFPPFEPAFVRRDGRKHYVLPEGFASYASEFEGSTW